VKIVRLREDEQLRKPFAVRYRIYVDELGRLEPCFLASQGSDPDALAAGLLTDRFDAVAPNYAAYDDEGVIVGSIRVLLDGPMGLPLEQCRPLDGYRAGRRLVEL